MSPDVRDALRLPHHRITRLAVERLPEIRVIRERTIHTPLRRRMRIRLHACDQARRPRVYTPALRIAEIETLLGRKAIDQTRPAIAGERALERVVSGEHTTVIRDVLTERERTIYMQRVHLDVAVELLLHQLRLLVEARRVRRHPP